MIGEKSLTRIKSIYSILLFQKILTIDILWEELVDFKIMKMNYTLISAF